MEAFSGGCSAGHSLYPNKAAALGLQSVTALRRVFGKRPSSCETQRSRGYYCGSETNRGRYERRLIPESHRRVLAQTQFRTRLEGEGRKLAK